MDKRIPVRRLFLKFVQLLTIQNAPAAAASALARIDQRLPHSILMISDRIGLETLPLTHEFLSLLLGVRGAGVTEAPQGRKRAELIDMS
jgi:hypothetical protein